ncbi:MAG: dihydrodipicolinate synthase family protein, partial [Rhizobium leguminosarum]
LEKNFDKGRAIMTAMLPLMDFLECGKFVQSIKHGCELIGLNVGSVRAPLRPLNSEEKRTLQTVVATLKRTVGQITSGANHA